MGSLFSMMLIPKTAHYSAFMSYKYLSTRFILFLFSHDENSLIFIRRIAYIWYKLSLPKGGQSLSSPKFQTSKTSYGKWFWNVKIICWTLDNRLVPVYWTSLNWHRESHLPFLCCQEDIPLNPRHNEWTTSTLLHCLGNEVLVLKHSKLDGPGSPMVQEEYTSMPPNKQ